MYFLLLDDKQHEPWEQGMRTEKRRWRRKRMPMKTQRCSSSSLQQRVESLQRHVDILRGARKDAVRSARDLRSANEKITAQLSSLTEKLSSSKQLTQVTHLPGGERGKTILRDIFHSCLSLFSWFLCIWDRGCSSSEPFAFIMPNKCDWQSYPHLWRSASWSRRDSLALLLSRPAQCFSKPDVHNTQCH